MGFFTTEAEKERRVKLKQMEDRRLRLAETLQKDGLRPERMLFCASEEGRFIAVARHNGKCAVIVSPIFGEDADFIVEYHDQLNFRKEEVRIKGEGLGGAFGFGRKGARGFNLFLELNCGETLMPVVAGRTSYLEVLYKNNPLLKTKRRRGDANVVWDMKPVLAEDLAQIESDLMTYYLV